MNLDEQLIDHLASKSFANPRELTRGFLGARLARESDFGADPRIIFLKGEVHRRRHYALWMTLGPRVMRWVSEHLIVGTTLPLLIYSLLRSPSDSPGD